SIGPPPCADPPMAACSDLKNCGLMTPLNRVTNVDAPPITGMGGTVPDGDYILVQYTLYAKGIMGIPGTTWVRETLRFTTFPGDGGMVTKRDLIQSTNENPKPPDQTTLAGTVQFGVPSPTESTIHFTCPGVSDFTSPYTVLPDNKLQLIYDTGALGVAQITYA